MRESIRALELQISKERKTIAGNGQALGSLLATYDRLTLERELAVKSLTSALTSLENARQEAQRQQLYLERIVEPNLPDQPEYPERLLLILAVTVTSLTVYFILRKVSAMVLEHHL